MLFLRTATIQCNRCAQSTQKFDAMSQHTNRERSRQELIAEIVSAFDGVEREDGITIHEAIAIDDYKSDEEQLDARRLDTEKRWQDVPAEAIVACDSALSFLDSKSFRYYLPAFMVCGLSCTNTQNRCANPIPHQSPPSTASPMHSAVPLLIFFDSLLATTTRLPCNMPRPSRPLRNGNTLLTIPFHQPRHRATRWLA